MLEIQIAGSLLGALAQIEPAVALAVAKTALDVEAGAKINIQTGDKTGIVYKRKDGEHQASAPGEAPATDTGTLVNSGEVVPVSALEQDVTFSADYAADLELGTVRIAPRPFLGPAVEAATPDFEAALAQAVTRTANKT